jgi:hypothetical protein
VTQPEAKFKRKLVDSFHKVFPDGWHAYTRSVVGAGLPDLRFAAMGRKAAWVEVKWGAGRLSKIQAHTITTMCAQGERVFVVTGSPEGLVLIHSGHAPLEQSALWCIEAKRMADLSFWDHLL